MSAYVVPSTATPRSLWKAWITCARLSFAKMLGCASDAWAQFSGKHCPSVLESGASRDQPPTTHLEHEFQGSECVGALCHVMMHVLTVAHGS